MVAIVDTDVSIDISGNIRWTGAATTNRHSVLEFIQWLMDKQDDEQAAGDDILDITVDTPFDRSTDQIVTLNSPFNIDDTFAKHLYDGSVSQTEDGEETLYAGLGIIGPVESGTEYMIVQDGKVLPSFWGTGINPEDTPSLVFSRHLVKVKASGAEIDGQRITVLARELGDQYRRFPASLGTGNSVAAIGNGADIFNTNTDGDIGGWTIVNTEGFQAIDIDGTGATDQDYYSQYEIGAQTVNDVYEYTKWISQRSHIADQTGGTPTLTDYIIDNATIVGQGQSFIPQTASEYLTEARFQIKIGAGTPTGTLYAELYDSDDAASQLAEPTGSALARSEDVLASEITATLEEVIFRFNQLDPTGAIAAQPNQLVLDNDEYFIVLRHDDGAAGDYFEVEGANTDQDNTMNQAVENPAATWTASATDDINLIVKSSPHLHGIAGERFEGISLDVGFDGEAGAGVVEDDICMWGTHIWYDNLVNGPFLQGEYIQIDNAGTLVTGAKVLYDNGADELILALDSPAAAVIADNYTITTFRTGTETTAIIDTGTGGGSPLEDEDLGGGTGLILAKDDNGTTGEIYIQVLSGVSPVENSRIRTDDLTANPIDDYVDATATITPRTLIPEYVGTSTGSNIIGAYGIGFDKDDVGSSDRFTDLDNGPRTPPNNVLFTVSGIVSGEDRVLVGPRTGTALDVGQWLLNTALSSSTETAVVVKTGTDTVNWPSNKVNWPATGIGANVSRLRVKRDDGIYARVPYDSHNSLNTFTLGTPVNAAVQIDVVATAGTFTRASGSFITDGFEKGCTFTGSLFGQGGNNAQFTADVVTTTVITVQDNTGMADETGSGDELLTSDGWSFNSADVGTVFTADEAAGDNEVFMAFIDVLASATSTSFTGVHDTVDRDIFVRVRDGGGTPIKTFESKTAEFKSTAQTIAAVRTEDA